MTVSVKEKPRKTCAAEGCTETGAEWEFTNGEYCSTDCYHRESGRKLLRNLQQDHRFCWSCWRARKELEQPSDDYRNQAFTKSGTALTFDEDGDTTVERYGQELSNQAVVGFEHHTWHVEKGPHGLECECGAVDHDIEAWDKRAEGPYHWFLLRAVEQMNAEGQHDYEFDIATFADTLWTEDDLELAVGRAIR